MGKKRDGTPSGQWAKMPGTMIRKVAMVHALREAFPEDFGGMYDSSEMGVQEQPADAYLVEAEDAEPWDGDPRPCDGGEEAAYEPQVTEMEGF